jgi:hypothetical protein
MLTCTHAKQATQAIHQIDLQVCTYVTTITIRIMRITRWPFMPGAH